MTAPCAFEIGDQARAQLSDLIDLQMSPIGKAAMDALSAAENQVVLDIGCGTGQTLLQMLERVGPAGRVIGVDVGPCVLGVARDRTAHLSQVELLLADAATLPLPDHSIDSIFSRFGIMFFADPIPAFRNFHRMLKPGGRIAFVCWRSMIENELDAFCVRSAGLPIMVDTTPFSFEDDRVIGHILRSAGFGQIVIQAHDADVSSGDADAMMNVVTRVGVVGKMLRERPTLLPEVEPRLRAALLEREREGKVTLGAATWIVTATAE